jgi:hypothetical protein
MHINTIIVKFLIKSAACKSLVTGFIYFFFKRRIKDLEFFIYEEIFYMIFFSESFAENSIKK